MLKKRSHLGSARPGTLGNYLNKPAVRINVDRRNVDFAANTFDFFREQEWFNSKYIAFYYGWIRNSTENVKDVESHVLSPEEFHQKSEVFKQRLREADCMKADYPKVNSGCVATNINGFVIGPGGDMWKCWSSIGDMQSSFGNVLGDYKPNGHFLEYMGTTWENDAECLACKVLPICMGGCGDIRINRDKGRIDHKDCGVWRYHIEEKLRVHFVQLGQDASNESPAVTSSEPAHVNQPISV